MDFVFFSVFELGGDGINEGCDTQNCYYAAVISSTGYPAAIAGAVSSAAIYNIPVGTYVTYTLLTPPDRTFPSNQVLQISDSSTLEFKRSLYSPLSGIHSEDQAISVLSFAKSGNFPVFLMKYAGKSQHKPDFVLQGRYIKLMETMIPCEDILRPNAGRVGTSTMNPSQIGYQLCMLRPGSCRVLPMLLAKSLIF